MTTPIRFRLDAVAWEFIGRGCGEIMALIPASTNEHYTGARASAFFLGLLGLGTLLPGCIHFFLPDGGAGVIAGIDLSQGGPIIVAAFAWMGATQIAWGAAQLAVALRYRPLVPLFLALALVERALAALAAWVTKPSPTGHHPPEHYIVLALLPLIVLFVALSLRRR
jgi:hypothetical protein